MSKTIAARCVVRDIQTGAAQSGGVWPQAYVAGGGAYKGKFCLFTEAVDTQNRQAALLQMIGVLAELERYPYQRTNPRGSEGRKWPEREICQMWLIF